MRHMCVNADGVEIAAKFHAPNDPLDDAPLVVAVHGGSYTSAYFEVVGSPAGSFVDAMNRALQHNLGVLTAEEQLGHARGTRWRTFVRGTCWRGCAARRCRGG